MLGPPGTAKSELARRLSGLTSGTYFERLLTRFSVPEELFGPLSMRGIHPVWTSAQTYKRPLCAQPVVHVPSQLSEGQAGHSAKHSCTHHPKPIHCSICCWICLCCAPEAGWLEPGSIAVAMWQVMWPMLLQGQEWLAFISCVLPLPGGCLPQHCCHMGV